jgi:hypothetical protein
MKNGLQFAPSTNKYRFFMQRVEKDASFEAALPVLPLLRHNLHRWLEGDGGSGAHQCSG